MIGKIVCLETSNIRTLQRVIRVLQSVDSVALYNGGLGSSMLIPTGFIWMYTKSKDCLIGNGECENYDDFYFNVLINTEK